MIFPVNDISCQTVTINQWRFNSGGTRLYLCTLSTRCTMSPACKRKSQLCIGRCPAETATDGIWVSRDNRAILTSSPQIQRPAWTCSCMVVTVCLWIDKRSRGGVAVSLFSRRTSEAIRVLGSKVRRCQQSTAQIRRLKFAKTFFISRELLLQLLLRQTFVISRPYYFFHNDLINFRRFSLDPPHTI